MTRARPVRFTRTLIRCRTEAAAGTVDEDTKN
jgi:hypothetical protein